MDTEDDVRAVFFAYVGKRQPDPRHIDPLAVGDHAVVVHLADDLGRPDLKDGQLDGAVIEQDGGAGLYIVDQAGEVDIGARLVPLTFLAGQHKPGTCGQLGLAALEGAKTDFRTSGIEQGGNRKPHLGAQAVYRFKCLEMALMGSMGKIEAGDIHAPFDQAADAFFAVGSGPKRAYDFCPSHKSGQSPCKSIKILS